MDPKYTYNRDEILVDEAVKRIESHIYLQDSEQVPIEASYHRNLAKEIVATHSLPHFTRSAMDGFALASEWTANATEEHPVILKVMEEIPCGAVPQSMVTSHSAARIMTGAMLPAGADTVVKLESVESVELDGAHTIVIREPLHMGMNVVPEGLELQAGELVLERGRRIEAGELALLATFGHQQIHVYKRPRVAIFATGSELLGLVEPLQAGKIRDSNSYLLAGLIRDTGGIPILGGMIPDDLQLARRLIEQTMPQVDLVITIGGVSVGDFDIMTEYFSKWDGEMLFNKVAMRPGSPTTVGVKDQQFLFALSGNPSSCYVGFQLFVRPVLWGMQGRRNIHLSRFEAILGEDAINPSSYPRYVRGKLRYKERMVYAHSVGIDHSSVTSSLKDTHCLIVISGDQKIMAGDKIEVIQIE